jgi:hypothetical protein
MSFKNTLFFVFLVSALIFWPQANVSALSAVVHVPEKYTDVVAGERFYFELEIRYPENLTRKDLRLEYNITKNGELISQSKILKAIETQASFMDYVVIPQNAEQGLYQIEVKISDYADLKEEVSASFKVTAGILNEIRIYFFIIIGVMVFVAMLVALNVYFIQRKKNEN